MSPLAWAASITALNIAGCIFGNFPNTSSTQIFRKSGLCAAASCTSATASAGVFGRYTWSGATGTGGAPSGAPMPRPAVNSDAPGSPPRRCSSRSS
ncbi:MAG: hypothetical protein E6J65_29095 [Deltaproteobacteria bacterium]|nr:MAG: hypothetical protein E6J65_29095 [Deltaproteobacteria bacterium]